MAVFTSEKQDVIGLETCKGPVFVNVTVGTNVRRFDLLAEVAAMCEPQGLWMHVDLMWAGSGIALPKIASTTDTTRVFPLPLYSPLFFPIFKAGLVAGGRRRDCESAPKTRRL